MSKVFCYRKLPLTYRAVNQRHPCARHSAQDLRSLTNPTEVLMKDHLQRLFGGYEEAWRRTSRKQPTKPKALNPENPNPFKDSTGTGSQTGLFTS